MNQIPKVLVYHTSDAQNYANLLRSSGYSHIETASTYQEAFAKLADVEVIFGWRFPTALLKCKAALSVRWIQSMGAGVDDLVGNREMPEHIVCTRIVDQFGGPISEYVFAYLLYLSKDLKRIDTAQREQRWDPFVTTCLANKLIGIAGLGSIGQELVRKARAFDMTVYGLSHGTHNLNLVDRHFRPSQWQEFVRDLDILVLALPLTQATREIVDESVLTAMKAGAWLVNIGRGALISDPSLLDVLHRHHLGAAVLDVFTTEPLPATSEFWTMDNVHVTPHLSGPSLSTKVSEFFLANLRRYVAGEPMIGVVNRQTGY